jgi:hypothetical protein
MAFEEVWEIEVESLVERRVRWRSLCVGELVAGENTQFKIDVLYKYMLVTRQNVYYDSDMSTSGEDS